MRFLLWALLAMGLALSAPTQAQDVEFGDDSSAFANDGECDDPRFEGPGMTATMLLESDRRADATDCQEAFKAGRVWPQGQPTPPNYERFALGDDSSEWANDGECDDPRFEGPGMTSTVLLDSDRFADATDCGRALSAGTVQFKDNASAGGTPNFGDDSSDYANDGECDDPRFEGPGMTATMLLESDRLADATDCRAAWERGELSLR